MIIHQLGGATGASRHIFLATGAYAAPPPEYAMALAETRVACAAAGFDLTVQILEGCCHVDDARNYLVRNFLESDADTLAWVDADVSWHGDDFVRLAKIERDIVAGVYPYRQTMDDGKQGFPVRLGSDTIQAESDGCVEVLGVPGGFTFVRRRVYEKLDAAYAHTRHKSRMDAAERKPLTIIYERTLDVGLRFSGDYEFCRKAKRLGFKSYVEPQITLGHSGKDTWTGCLGDYWRRENGLDVFAFVDAMKELKSGEHTPTLFRRLFASWNNPFAMGGDFLQATYAIASESDGSAILEVGSGLSTLVMGAAAMRSGRVIHALEHDPDWFKRVTAALERYEIGEYVRVHYAPLRFYGKEMWYEIPADLPSTFSVAIIDGPPRRFGRETVFRVMLDRIRDATWLIDDADDPKEFAVLQRWAQQTGREVSRHGHEGLRQFAIAGKRLAA